MKRVTASELINELENDKEFQAKRKILELEREAIAKRLTENEKPLLVALKSVGIEAKSIWDLVNTRVKYPEAIETLTQHIQFDYELRIKEGIVRALSVIEARGISNEVLFEEYYKSIKNPENELYCWAIGNAIATIMLKTDLNNIVKIVTNKEYGISRQMFVIALARAKTPESEKILIDLLDDNDVVLHAILGVKRHKSINAINKLADLLTSSRTEVRKDAKKALESIQKHTNK